ncbi:MAG: 50S ribosomal protein L7/L12, partial [Verrucomicrobiota bacterium]
MSNIAQLVEQLGKLTVLEAVDLVKQLEETWGVSAAAPVAMMAGPAAAA